SVTFVLPMSIARSVVMGGPCAACVSSPNHRDVTGENACDLPVPPLDQEGSVAVDSPTYPAGLDGGAVPGTDFKHAHCTTRHPEPLLEARPKRLEAAFLKRVERLLELMVQPACEGDPVHGTPRCAADARGRRPEVVGERFALDVQVHADPKHQKCDAGSLCGELHQNSRRLQAIDQD